MTDTRIRFQGIMAAELPRKTYNGGKGFGPVDGRAHECYMNATLSVVMPETRPIDSFLLVQLLQRFKFKRVELVHGFPRRTGAQVELLGNGDVIPADCRYGHAWIELHGSPTHQPMVYDAVSVTMMDRATYYEAGTIEPDQCFRYSEEQAISKVLATESAGPWDDYAGEGRVYWTDDDDVLHAGRRNT